jgi:hypothetical protein
MWPVIDRLRHTAADQYIEVVLEEIKAEAETFPINFKYLASLQFYLREVVYSTTQNWQQKEAAGATNHSTLMGMLYEWRIRHQSEPVVLVTFNYDCLLDDARIPFSAQPIDLDGYIAADDFPLLKPHGSVNWFVEVSGVGRGLGSASYDPGSQTLIDVALGCHGPVSPHYRLRTRPLWAAMDGPSHCNSGAEQGGGLIRVSLVPPQIPS